MLTFKVYRSTSELHKSYSSEMKKNHMKLNSINPLNLSGKGNIKDWLDMRKSYGWTQDLNKLNSSQSLGM